MGLHVWAGGVRVTPAFTCTSTTDATTASSSSSSSGQHGVAPFYNLAMQDALPLALTHCSRAFVKQPPPRHPNPGSSCGGGGGHVSGRIGDEDDEDDDDSATAAPPSCPAALGARTSYRTAYRGGASLCVSGLLHPGAGATRATLPLFALDAPAPALALELRVVYKAPHGIGEDDFCLELVLQGEGASAAAERATKAGGEDAETVGAMGRLRGVLAATATTTHVILRPAEEAAEGSGGSSTSSKSSSWGSRQVGKVLETTKGTKRTRKLFFAPVSDAPVGATGGGEATEGVLMTSEQALAATVAQAQASSKGQPPASALSLENVYNEAVLEGLPWRQRVFRVRDLALEGARVKELRLVCVKKTKKKLDCSDDHADDDPLGLPLPYCLFLGELSLGQVRKPPAPATPSAAAAAAPRLSGPSHCLLLNPADGNPTLRCQRLELRLAHWDATSRQLSGQLVWAWAAEEGQDDDPSALVANTDVLLFGPFSPIWVGRAFTAAFALSIALPEGGYGKVRLVLQPRDRLGSVLPLCSCPSLSVELLQA